MEFHRHAMIDVERLLDVAEAARDHLEFCESPTHTLEQTLAALDQEPVA
jgi:hypothetical protein